MARKKSVKKAVERFCNKLDGLKRFVAEAEGANVSDQFVTYAHELAIIKLYTAFENLMLDAIVAAINNDTTTLAHTTGVNFPKHLTDEVCEFLVVGKGYFDFKGRDGLIRLLKDYVPSDHYLVDIVSDSKYKDALERLYTLRNFAAHESDASKAKAKAAVGCNMSTAGSWLKTQGRFGEIAGSLTELAQELKQGAPF